MGYHGCMGSFGRLQKRTAMYLCGTSGHPPIHQSQLDSKNGGMEKKTESVIEGNGIDKD